MWSAIYHIANSTSKPSGIPENLPPDVDEFLDGCFERSWRPSPFPLAYHLNPPHYAPSPSYRCFPFYSFHLCCSRSLPWRV